MLKDNRGILPALIPLIGGAAKAAIPSLVGAGAKWGLGKLFGGGGDDSGTTVERSAPQFLQNPEYEEAKGARATWWDKLQQWGSQPGYGAIAPNWGDIWKRAQDKIRHHYWGGPGGQTGISDKVRASAARRGVSESPALETQIGQMGMQEASDLSGIATTMATKEAEFGEQGRQNYMRQLMGLAEQKPSGQWWSPGQTTSEGGGGSPFLAGLGEGLTKAFVPPIQKFVGGLFGGKGKKTGAAK